MRLVSILAARVTCAGHCGRVAMIDDILQHRFSSCVQPYLEKELRYKA